MHTYLRSLVDALNQLYRAGSYIAMVLLLFIFAYEFGVGVEVSTPDGVHICRGMMLTCLVDLPARALLCKMKSYNGAHSYPTCLDSGDNTVGACPMHRYWPFNLRCEIRALVGVQRAFKEASTIGTAVSTCIIAQNHVFLWLWLVIQLIRRIWVIKVSQFLHFILLSTWWKVLL